MSAEGPDTTTLQPRYAFTEALQDFNGPEAPLGRWDLGWHHDRGIRTR